ncbi:MAG TPA: FmdE family protein [Phycisphaerae bacterium]|nr:FmdE family protein [Phycisphaerae bacterium]
MTTSTREDLLDRCVDFHGHLCLGQVLGVRLALKGMELIGTRDPRQMIVFIENDRCIADAIQSVTGTRIGRRSAKLINYGKMAATFINTETSQTYRVNVRQVDPDARHAKDAIRRVLHVPDAELLAWKKVTVSLKPEDLPGKPLRTVHCARCDERIFDGRDVQADEGPLCLSCAHGAYYQIVDTNE